LTFGSSTPFIFFKNNYPDRKDNTNSRRVRPDVLSKVLSETMGSIDDCMNETKCSIFERPDNVLIDTMSKNMCFIYDTMYETGCSISQPLLAIMILNLMIQKGEYVTTTRFNQQVSFASAYLSHSS